MEKGVFEETHKEGGDGEKHKEGGDRETHKEGGTEKRTIFGKDTQTDTQTHRGSYRGGAHLKNINVLNILFALVHILLERNQFCRNPVLGLGLGVDFTFATDNNNNNKNNPHLNFLKGTVLGDKEQGLGIKDKA